MLRRSTITESGFTVARFEAAREFFTSLGYTCPFVTCTNDATALKPELVWRQRDDALLGFVLDDDQLPFIEYAFTAGTKLSDIRKLLAKHSLGTQLELYLINPLNPRIPSFVLAAFVDKHRASAVHAARWRTIDKMLALHGLHVISHSCDGDPAHLSTQLARASGAAWTRDSGEEPRRFTFNGAISINGTSHAVSTSSRNATVGGASIQVPLLHFQDMEHEGLKIRYEVSSVLLLHIIQYMMNATHTQTKLRRSCTHKG